MDHTALLCLLGFAAWQMVLVCAIAAARTLAILKGEKKSNEFTSGQPHGSDVYWRLNRAHINTAENLAVFAVAVFVANAVGVPGEDIATVAKVWLAARIAQSLFHISSNSEMTVNLRFASLGVQIACFFAVAWKIISSL